MRALLVLYMTGSVMQPDIGLIEVDIIGRNSQFPALRHRVSGIGNQIQEHLLELAWISGDTFQRWGQDRD